MASTTQIYGVILILVGTGGYLGSGQASPTALIPAAFGLLFVILGQLAKKDSMRKHVMHAAALLGVFGLAGSISGLPALFRMIGGQSVDRPLAAIARSIMAVLMVSFLVQCIQSFREARKARAAG